MTIGDRIKTARKRLGMTQKEVADEFGLTVQAVSAWERNQTKDLSRDRFEKLVTILQVTREWLEGKAGNLPPLKDQLPARYQSLSADQKIVVQAVIDALFRENSKRSSKELRQ